MCNETFLLPIQANEFEIKESKRWRSDWNLDIAVSPKNFNTSFIITKLCEKEYNSFLHIFINLFNSIY